MVECYPRDGLDSGPKPAKRPGRAESTGPSVNRMPGPSPLKRHGAMPMGSRGSGLNFSSPRGMPMASRGSSSEVSTSKGRPPAGRVNNGNGNSRRVRPTAGMVNGGQPPRGNANGWHGQPAQWQHRQWGNRSNDRRWTVEGKDGKDTGPSGTKASGISGSTGRVRPTAGMVNGTAGRVSRVMPTPGRVSTSKASKQGQAAGWNGQRDGWQGQHQQGQQQQAQQPATGQSHNSGYPYSPAGYQGHQVPPGQPVRLVQPVRPVPTNIPITGPFRRVSLPPQAGSHSGSYANSLYACGRRAVNREPNLLTGDACQVIPTEPTR